MTLLIH